MDRADKVRTEEEMIGEMKNAEGFALGFVIQALSNNLNSGSEEALLY